MPRDNEGRKMIGVIFFNAATSVRRCVLSFARGGISGILTAGTPEFDILEYTLYFIFILFKRDEERQSSFVRHEKFFDI